MYITDVKNLIENPIFKVEQSDVITTECAVETYFNRLILIGLRLKGAQYEQSQALILSNHVEALKSLDVAIKLIDEKKLVEFQKNQSVQKLRRLFENFSLPCRNKLIHGKKGGFDIETIKMCIKINMSYIVEIENALKEVMGHSAFDTPTAWGARKNSSKLSEKEIEKIKFNGQKNDWNVDKAQLKYAELNIQPLNFIFDSESTP